MTEIQKLQRDLQDRTRLSEVRWTRPEQLHLTLRFFGNVPIEQVDDLKESLRRSIGGIRPFCLTLTGLGCFPSITRPSVIWVGIEGDLAELEKLSRQIEAQTSRFGSHAEEREFRPHLTIGRIKVRPRPLRRREGIIPNMPVPKLGDWPVSELHLTRSTLSSEGSSYTLLAAFPMSPTPGAANFEEKA